MKIRKDMDSVKKAKLTANYICPVDATDFLNQALAEMKGREQTYDSPGGERSMANTVAMFNVYAKTNITVEQGWGFMLILKLIRSQQGDYKGDNYVDACAYAGLAGEQARTDRKKQDKSI